jgi:diaminohydroxyphosphoribosylaminopyrimidine deaminase / 5-amino-6-(5-phosphoribosylamino)uracil reductase
MAKRMRHLRKNVVFPAGLSLAITPFAVRSAFCAPGDEWIMTLREPPAPGAAHSSRPVTEACHGFVSGHPGRPFVVAQLGQALDGRIATVSGESRWINGGAALDHLHRLRAAVDAVLVGVGTVVADNPRLDVRRVEGPSPARVVVDPRGRVPVDALVFRDDGIRRIVIRGRHAAVPPGVEELVVPADANGALPPMAILAALKHAGFARVLVEGGAATISRFIDAETVDRLHILMGQVIIGAGPTGLSLQPRPRLSDALRPRIAAYPLDDGDVLFDCDFRKGEGRGANHGGA